jgi:hypothetical protein
MLQAERGSPRDKALAGSPARVRIGEMVDRRTTVRLSHTKPWAFAADQPKEGIISLKWLLVPGRGAAAALSVTRVLAGSLFTASTARAAPAPSSQLVAGT